MKNASLKTLMLLAFLSVPALMVGCRGEIDEDGADLEVGTIAPAADVIEA